MHTIEVASKAGPIVFNYNSDLSGDVIITHDHGREVCLPGNALLIFIANYVRDVSMEALEVRDLSKPGKALAFLRGNHP